MIEAAYYDKCPGCGGEIYAGDEIGLVDEEWVCKECVDAAGGEDEEWR